MKVPFPSLGLIEGAASVEQPAQSSFSLLNIRPYDVTKEKIRGGKRPGTTLMYWTQVGGDHPIIAMTQITTTYIMPEV